MGSEMIWRWKTRYINLARAIAGVQKVAHSHKWKIRKDPRVPQTQIEPGSEIHPPAETY
ncbi:hypothetical protein [Mesorhizobium sp. LSJC280B00]|uniref:hypothetical protein n=1 Tax=Mesorhizobium sp. LSJC280B00 TaxID=1287336 RepID=UPI0018DD4E9F|nr:hypothetical protein [Mesorhizobium sp. LSJC280B00]